MIKNIISAIIALFFINCYAYASSTGQSSTQNIVTNAQVKSDIEILDARAKNIVGSNDIEVFLTIRNNSATTYNLINSSSDKANETLIYGNVTDASGNVVSSPIDGNIPILPNSDVVFGTSMSIRLIDIKSTLTAGDIFILGLYFDHDLKQEVNVQYVVN